MTASRSDAQGTAHVVGLSGGYDSTAMALRLRELHPERQFIFLCTPTGDELPAMRAHWHNLERILEQPLVRITNQDLAAWTRHFAMLPSTRRRWCTRLLKIEPTIAYLARLETTTGAKPYNYVGLRADEEERRGIYASWVRSVFPLRLWGWDRAKVEAYVQSKGVCVPPRTDCARCPYQRLGEWYSLWMLHPDVYESAVQEEARVSAERGVLRTFRSPSRDTWPAALADLRKRFQAGDVPRGVDEDGTLASCRVCRL